MALTGLGRNAAAVAAAAVLLSGCGLIGGTSALQQNAPDIMTVTGPVVGHATMPAQYTCYGSGQSPPLYWSGAPPRTKSLALVVDDAAAPITPYIYWIVFNISPTTVIQAGHLPHGAWQAVNSSGRARYQPPCPHGQHRYRFTVYALNAALRLRNGAGLKAAWSAIARHAIARGTLTVTAESNGAGAFGVTRW